MFQNTVPTGHPKPGAEATGPRKMTENGLPIDIDAIDRLASETGLGVALVDGHSREVATANNNSICRSLNPTGEFSAACAQFCGKAFEKSFEVGKAISFVCHAGLDCRAVPAPDAAKPFVAIIGRTFLRSENYRNATERAIVGDWRRYPPTEFFENILLTGSKAVLDNATRQVAQLIREKISDATQTFSDLRSPAPPSAIRRDSVVLDILAEHTPSFDAEPRPVLKDMPEKTPRAGVSAWRSFFGSILKNDYSKAAESLLRFLAGQYGLTNLVWLETKGDKLEHTAGLGAVNRRKARLGIRPDDQRLVEAFHKEMPLELAERGGEGASARVMSLFPIGVEGQITAAIAVLDQIEHENKRHIARICHSISHQLEILRLRNEAAASDAFTTAVRQFGESLKDIDTDDPWQGLTQKTAEILNAERASLLLFNENTGSFDIKALIGAKEEPPKDEEAGMRAARIVFAKKEPVVVADVAKTGLPPAPRDRNYKTPSFLSCPINVGARTIGVMSFTDRASPNVFDRRSVELFQAIAPQLAVAVDHATLKARAGEFEQLSVTDPLTGLLNRRYIETRLLEEVRRSNRNGSAMSFMMLDVDHFKSYNDEFGHPAGDDALKLVGHVIRQTLRGADVAARFGGEEFSILLPETTADEASAIAERIRSNIQNTAFPHRGVTASIGVASCSAELCVLADLISAADRALYEAKRRGRNRVQSSEELNGVPGAP